MVALTHALIMVLACSRVTAVIVISRQPTSVVFRLDHMKRLYTKRDIAHMELRRIELARQRSTSSKAEQAEVSSARSCVITSYGQSGRRSIGSAEDTRRSKPWSHLRNSCRKRRLRTPSMLGRSTPILPAGITVFHSISASRGEASMAAASLNEVHVREGTRESSSCAMATFMMPAVMVCRRIRAHRSEHRCSCT